MSVKKTATNFNTSTFRINFVNHSVLLIVFLFIVRLFQIQVLDHDTYKALAQEQYWDLREISARRGNILSSDGYPLATTQVSYLLYAEPKRIEDHFQVAYDLAKILAEFNKYELKTPFEYYQDKIRTALSLDLYWVKLHGELTPEEKQKIAALGIAGIGFEEEPKRYYPEKTLASHVLGFVAHNSAGEPQGYFGIEGSLDGDLKGRPGRIIEEQDATGGPILVGGYKRIDPINGRDVVLTINRAIQYMVEKHLQEGVEKYGAVSGSVIVMNPFTGDIVAMANYPTYDPANFNDFGESDSQDLELQNSENATFEPPALNDEGATEGASQIKKIERKNFAISQTYEPGSVMKALTVSSAVDMGKVTPETAYVDAGPVQYSDYVIDNWDGKHHGTLTIVGLLQKSNNIGAAWVGHLVGAQGMHDYFTKFGFGRISGVELEGEDTGILRPYDTWTDIDLATVSFGQGISATPLQVLNVFNVIANGGNLIQPRIVSELIDDGRKVEIPVKIIERVISKKTSETMVDMLTKAVEGGESRYFNIKNYYIAGKTGTAQIPEGGKYNPNKTNATFVGFLTNSKRFSMIVRLEEPSASIYAAETAVPLWMDIANDLIRFYGIAPDRFVDESSI